MKSIRNYQLLLLGIALVALTHTRYSLGILVFLEPIPFLIYLDRNKGVKPILTLFGVLFVAWTLATLKIATDPIPWFISPAYGLPLALFKFGAFVGYRFLDGKNLRTWVFPALFTLAEWLQASFTPFATWGSVAYTQVDNLVWMQSVSVGGLWLLSFALYFMSFQIYEIFSLGVDQRKLNTLAIPILLISVFGSVRLSFSEASGETMIKIATVGTSSVIGPGTFPDLEERAANQQLIYNRMTEAQQAGASLVVWTEAATGVLPEEETTFQTEASRIVDSLGVTAVVAYVVPLQFEPLIYENKYIIINEEGEIIQTYMKHEPVPGEPAIKGKTEHALVDMHGIALGGAICYDFDFPGLGRSIAKLGADIVAVPSSDWRGIDPIHTQMAAFRAVEGGFSLIRSTRWGLSAAVDPLGRYTGRLSDFDTEDKIMIAELPAQGQPTLYGRWGDWVILVCLAIIAWAVFNRRAEENVQN